MNGLLSPSLNAHHFHELAHELKFVVARPLAEQVLTWARHHLEADPFGSSSEGDCYTITSLYFDTANFDVLHHTGSFGRGKYRIRRYGSSEAVFLERKMKSHGLVGKRRTEVPLAELSRVAAPDPDRNWAGFSYHRRILVRRLRPICLVSYTRTARVGTTSGGPIRLTLDDRITACSLPVLGFEGIGEPVRLSGDGLILELKYRRQMPPLFEDLIRQFRLLPQPASKYRRAGAMLGFSQETMPCLIS